MQVLIFEKVIIYIPVAEDTLGGTPRLMSNGLKITPPPSPRAPATHPATNPKVRTFHKTCPLNMRSDLTILMLLNSCFNFYSDATNLAPTATKHSIRTKNTPNNVQSPVEHFSKPFVPRRRVIMTRQQRARKFINCFFQIP